MVKLRLPDKHPGYFGCPYFPGTKSSGSLAFPGGTIWGSQVPGFPFYMHALLFDPGGYKDITAAQYPRYCLPVPRVGRHHNQFIFEAQSHSLHAHYSQLHGSVTLHRLGSLLPCRQAFGRWDSHPLRNFFQFPLALPLEPGLSWRDVALERSTRRG